MLEFCTFDKWAVHVIIVHYVSDIDFSFSLPKTEQHKCAWIINLPVTVKSLFSPFVLKMLGGALLGTNYVNKVMSNPEEIKNVSIFNFKLYLFYNTDVRLQISHKVTFLGGK